MITTKVISVQDVEVKTLVVSAQVRYWEDAEVNGKEDTEGNLIPCRNGENWEPKIDLEAGVIANWPAGTVAKIHYKVCDAGIYQLADAAGKIIKEIDGYVPSIMCPADNGYGDYIIMNVDASGKIDKWRVDLSDFEEEKD